MFSRPTYWVPICCFVLGLVFFVAGVYYHLPLENGLALEASPIDIELLGCKAGETREVVLQLVNHSDRPIPIIGSAGS